MARNWMPSSQTDSSIPKNLPVVARDSLANAVKSGVSTSDKNQISITTLQKHLSVEQERRLIDIERKKIASRTKRDHDVNYFAD